MIAIIDYGMGNLNSVAKAFTNVAPEADVRITSDASVVDRASHVVLPGQAAMPDSMRALNESGLREATVRAAKSGRPFLGVCLGLHMLFEHSEEGDCDALGLFPGKVQRFPTDHRDSNGALLKVPHMGWNEMQIPAAQKGHFLWEKISENSAFYFAHSYYAVPHNRAGVAGTANYPDSFCVAFGQANVFAVQFHPEKSAHAGLTLLRNFTLWNGNA